MFNLATLLWKDEKAVIISAELTLVLTLSGLAMVVGLSSVSRTVNNELADIGSAFGAINQSYSYQGMGLAGGNSLIGGSSGFGQFGGVKAYVTGSGFLDSSDFCDCSEVIGFGGTRKWDGTGGGYSAGGIAVGSNQSYGGSVAPGRRPAPIVSAPAEKPCDKPCDGPGPCDSPCDGVIQGPLSPAPDTSVPQSKQPKYAQPPSQLQVPPPAQE